MSGGLDVLSMKDDDVAKMLAAGVHLGDSNFNFQMEQYIFKARSDGTAIINVKKTWEKLMLAARVIAAVENPADICAISSATFGQRAILKFCKYTGTVPIAGRFTPGTFTNQIQKAFREPRLLIVSDPIADHQAVTEASYVNLPVIAFCNTNAPLRFIDFAIPCNNNGKHSLGLMWWFLTREVLRLKGSISREVQWDVVPDLFFYRDPEEVEKEEQAKLEQEETLQTGNEWGGGGVTADNDDWGDATTTPTATTTAPTKSDWGAETMTTTEGGSTTQPPIPTPGAGFVSAGEGDWNIENPGGGSRDWGADDEVGDWGGSTTVNTAGKW